MTRSTGSTMSATASSLIAATLEQMYVTFSTGMIKPWFRRPWTELPHCTVIYGERAFWIDYPESDNSETGGFVLESAVFRACFEKVDFYLDGKADEYVMVSLEEL